MKKNLIFFLLIFGFLSGFAQKQIDITKATDCNHAYALNTAEVNGPFQAPAASGVEIFGRKEYAAWFKFLATKDGKLIFDIVPGDSADNYDFELYKFDNSPNFCTKLKENKIKPLRKNYFGFDTNVKGRTGLTVLGNGKTYGKSVLIKNGETYYLKTSNLLAERSGNLFIVFNYLKTYHLKGTVNNTLENEKNLKEVKITCLNTRNGEFVGETMTNKNGEFNLEIGVKDKAHEFPFYELTFYHPKYLVYDTIVSSSGLLNLIKKPLNIQLIKLKKDMKYPYSIYFSPNSPKSLVEPQSYITLRKILKLMVLNPQINIKIEGHSNGFYPSTEIDQRLSEGRAKTVKEYFIERGISTNRINIHGNGCKQMLFPYPTNEKEEGFNRRVEIFITKIK